MGVLIIMTHSNLICTFLIGSGACCLNSGANFGSDTSSQLRRTVQNWKLYSSLASKASLRAVQCKILNFKNVYNFIIQIVNYFCEHCFNSQLLHTVASSSLSRLKVLAPILAKQTWLRVHRLRLHTTEYDSPREQSRASCWCPRCRSGEWQPRWRAGRTPGPGGTPPRTPGSRHRRQAYSSML